MPISAEIASNFVHLRAELFRRFPATEEEATRHADELVDAETADADQIWAILWNRPLFAGRRTTGAHTFIGRVQSSMTRSWREMDDASRYGIVVEEDSGKHWLADDAFVVTGAVAKEWHSTHKLPAKTVYAITNAGKALLKRSSNKAPYSDLVGQTDLDNVTVLMKEFGWGWSHITVCHFLTDLGLACKPDIHLVRTMKALGLFNGKSDKVTISQAIEVVASVRELVVAVHGGFHRRFLREMDKHLMEISSCGIIENPFPKKSKKPRKSETSID